jgi:DnaJ-domain-containing protein 1
MAKIDIFETRSRAGMMGLSSPIQNYVELMELAQAQTAYGERRVRTAHKRLKKGLEKKDQAAQDAYRRIMSSHRPYEALVAEYGGRKR